MNENKKLSVVEMEEGHVDLIVNYWKQMSPEFLTGMGVDTEKLPSIYSLEEMLHKQVKTSYDKKKSYALIWMNDGIPIGHSNVNMIKYTEVATMHLHLWQPEFRQKGMGTELVKKSLPYYFDKLKLKKLVCNPYALNSAPNKTLERVGFEYVGEEITIPGPINFEQKVKKWEMYKELYTQICSS